MKKVTVIQTARMDRFEDMINKNFADGWELHGSPFVSQAGQIVQLMVKEESSVKGSTTKKTGGSV
jgi:hypothetical protein